MLTALPRGISARITQRPCGMILSAVKLFSTGSLLTGGANRMIFAGRPYFWLLRRRIMYMAPFSLSMAGGCDVKIYIMEIRFEHSPKEVRGMTTAELRAAFLTDRLIQADVIKLGYTHYDRVILGGDCPG